MRVGVGVRVSSLLLERCSRHSDGRKDRGEEHGVLEALDHDGNLRGGET